MAPHAILDLLTAQKAMQKQRLGIKPGRLETCTLDLAPEDVSAYDMRC